MPETIGGSVRLESKLAPERVAARDIQVRANDGPSCAHDAGLVLAEVITRDDAQAGAGALA